MGRINKSKITSYKDPYDKKAKTVDKYNTTIYAKVPELDTDLHFISQAGDRLDNLAQQFYGSPHLWWFIARVNNIKTMNLPPGISLRIPSTTKLATAVMDKSNESY